VNTLHISFGAHYVTVASELTELCRELTTMVEPMLRLQTRGTQVGFLKVSLTGNSFVVRGFILLQIVSVSLWLVCLIWLPIVLFRRWRAKTSKES